MEHKVNLGRSKLRLPVQAAPVIRVFAGGTFSHSTEGVGASRSARDWACTIAAGLAEKVVGSRGGDALYQYCMG
jgi:hypothetical protein